MESLFFNAGERRYRTALRRTGSGTLRRVDISNGLVALQLATSERGYRQVLRGIDRLVVLTLVKKGGYTLEREGERFEGCEGASCLYTSSRQDFALSVAPGSDISLFAVADFFLKRYLSGSENDPIDHLYHQTQSSDPLLRVDEQPTDALSLYLAKRILSPRREGRMHPLRVEHDLIELLIHRFEMVEPAGGEIDEASAQIVRRATAHLAERFADPPTIAELARLCATNTTTLKRLFKAVHGRTIGAHVRRLRLLRANQLLKDGEMSISEVARRVGFRHHGHFSRLFYEAFGIYPKDLK